MDVVFLGHGRVTDVFCHILEQGSFTAGEYGVLFYYVKYLIVINGFRLFFDYDFVLVFADYVEVVGTLVKVGCTHSCGGLLHFILALDFLLHFGVGGNLEFGSLHGVEHFFRQHFGLLLLYALRFLFLRLFFLDIVGGHFDHRLFGGVLWTGLGLLNHGVDCPSQNGYCE